MTKAKEESVVKAAKGDVQMYALPGKTIQLAMNKGSDGDKNRGIPKTAPRMRVVHPKTTFVCSLAESKSLISQGAAMLASDMPKAKTDQEKTDEAAGEVADEAAGGTQTPPELPAAT